MDNAENARRTEVERALRLLRTGRDPGQVMEALSRRLTNKLLHAPIRAITEKELPCTSTS
jgi:glutamyl-tRNA reductase